MRNRGRPAISRRDFFRATKLTGSGALGFVIARRAIQGRVPQGPTASKPGAFAEKQTYTFKVADNADIQADVYRPAGEAIVPAILWIHGGALIMGHRGSINPDQLDRYIKAGFAVISVDYRLAPEVKLKAIIEDIQDAHRWARAKGPELFRIDPERIGVIGHSAGGYLTLMTGFSVQPRPRALISFYGYGDITGAWYSRPDPFYLRQPLVSKEEAYGAVGGSVISGTPGPHKRGRFYLYCRQQGLWPREVAGHDPDKESRTFDPFCPVRNVTRDYPPTLLLHGDQDTDVPYEQSVLMARQLSLAGVEHHVITIPGGGHGFDRKLEEPVVARAFDQVLAFLRRHLNV